MTGRSTWWRHARGMFAALLLTIFAVGPSLDAVLCGQEQAAAVALQDDHSGAQHPDDGACVHGHCHHAAAYAPAEIALAYAPIALEQKLGPARQTRPTSDIVFELKRPPRA